MNRWLSAAIVSIVLIFLCFYWSKGTLPPEPKPPRQMAVVEVPVRYNAPDKGRRDTMVDEELLKILVCPEDKTPVRLADDELMAKINGAIEAGALKNRGGEAISEQAETGLVREDNAYLYLIRDDIPIMLIDEAVPLDQVE